LDIILHLINKMNRLNLLVIPQNAGK